MSSDKPSSSTSSIATSVMDLVNPGKTQGVKNIEAAYSRAGASAHHTPGYATKLGSQKQAPAGGEGQGDVQKHQGIGSEEFGQKIQDQRKEPTVIGKMFNNVINGTDQTK